MYSEQGIDIACLGARQCDHLRSRRPPDLSGAATIRAYYASALDGTPDRNAGAVFGLRKSTDEPMKSAPVQVGTLRR
jgi:hypothetical protein